VNDRAAVLTHWVVMAVKYGQGGGELAPTILHLPCRVGELLGMLVGLACPPHVQMGAPHPARKGAHLMLGQGPRAPAAGWALQWRHHRTLVTTIARSVDTAGSLAKLHKYASRSGHCSLMLSSPVS
jgi:hypothetical protein